MKKIISSVLAMLMLVSCFAGMTTSAYANSKIHEENISGINYCYIFDKNEAKITEIDVTDSFKGKTLTLPSKLGGKKVTTVEEGALCGASNISNLVIPDSIVTIKSRSLLSGKFSSVKIGASLKTIKDGAIDNYALKTITVSKSNKNFSVKDNVLYNKDKTVLYLYPSGKKGKSFTVPSTVKEIKSNAFCFSKLSKIKLPERLEKVGDLAFGYSKITSMSLPKTVTRLGYAAFASCKELKSVDLEKTKIKSIGYHSFRYDNKLTSVKLPDTVTEIGHEAFGGCKLSTLDLPKSLKTIDDTSFIGSGAKSIKISKDNKSFSAENGILFNKDKTTLICYPMNKSGKSYTVPKTVTKFSYGAFCFCQSLQSVDASKTRLKSIAPAAFEWDENLKTIKLPNTYNKIGYGAFYNTNISKFNFPNSLEEIGNFAFTDTSLTSVDLSKTKVTKIGSAVFSGTKLKSVKLPNNIKSIGSAFESCKYLKEIDLSKTKLTAISSYAFYGSGIEKIKFPSTLKKIGWSAFENTPIKSIVIPASVKEIGDMAFSNCTELVDIYVKNSEVEYGYGVFNIWDDEYYDEELDEYIYNTIITLHGAKNSTTEEYAKNNYLKFVAE